MVRRGGARPHYSSRQAPRRCGAGYRAVSTRGVMGVVVRGPCGRARRRSCAPRPPRSAPTGPLLPGALGCIAHDPPGTAGSRSGMRPGRGAPREPCAARAVPAAAPASRRGPHAGCPRRLWGFLSSRGRAGLLNLQGLCDLAAVASVGAVQFATRTLPPPPQSRELMGRHISELHLR